MRVNNLAMPEPRLKQHPAPPRLLVGIAEWLTTVTRCFCIASAALALLLPLPVLYEVGMDMAGNPPIWVFETTGYAIIMIAFAASGYGLSTGHHFRITLLPDRFPRLAQPLARFSALLQVIFGLVLLIAGISQVSTDYFQDLQSDTLLAVPQYLPQLAFPIGGLVIALQGFAHLLVPPARKPRDAVRG
jgi:TRAP-type C4-dicarboxylate transport system permease small subunit